jgi:hypothetical protein
MDIGRSFSPTLDLLAVFHFPPVSYKIRNFGKPIALLATYVYSSFLLGLFFDLED